MPTPTQAEVETQISNVVRIWANYRDWTGVTASTNFLANLDTLIQSLEGNYTNELVGSVASFRSTLAAAMGGEGGAISPLLVEMGAALGFPETSVLSIFQRLYTEMADASQAVQSRQMTFGAVAADGSNTGTGTIYRCHQDARGYDMEGCIAEAKEAMVIADASSGTEPGQELFQFTGSDPARDNLKIEGSGIVTNIRAVTSNDSKTGNSSWTNFSGASAAAPTAITDWTVGNDIANFEIDQTNFYRPDPSDGGNPASLKFKANDYVEQLFSLRNISLNPSVPYWISLAYNREIGLGDGDLTLWCGAQYVTVTLAAQTGWNILNIPVGTAQFLRAINETDASVKVNLASNTTGYVLTDDLLLVGMQGMDGTFYLPVGGITPFLYTPGTGDKFTWSDTDVAGALIQTAMFLSYGRYLPHATGGSVTWADPT